MNEYLNAIRKDCEHYQSKESKDAVKIMISVKNDLDKVKNCYQNNKY